MGGTFRKGGEKGRLPLVDDVDEIRREGKLCKGCCMDSDWWTYETRGGFQGGRETPFISRWVVHEVGASAHYLPGPAREDPATWQR